MILNTSFGKFDIIKPEGLHTLRVATYTGTGLDHSRYVWAQIRRHADQVKGLDYIGWTTEEQEQGWYTDVYKVADPFECLNLPEEQGWETDVYWIKATDYAYLGGTALQICLHYMETWEYKERHAVNTLVDQHIVQASNSLSKQK